MTQMMLALTTVFTLTAIASTTQAQGLTFAPSKGQSERGAAGQGRRRVPGGRRAAIGI